MATSKTEGGDATPPPAPAPVPQDALAAALDRQTEMMKRQMELSHGGPVAPAVGLFEAPAPGGVYRHGKVLRNAHGDVVDASGKVKAAADDEG